MTFSTCLRFTCFSTIRVSVSYQRQSGPSEAQTPVLRVLFASSEQVLVLNTSVRSQHPTKDWAQSRCNQSEVDRFLNSTIMVLKKSLGQTMANDNGDTHVTKTQSLLMRSSQGDGEETGKQVSQQSRGTPMGRSMGWRWRGK